jgi:hypothetical protein
MNQSWKNYMKKQQESGEPVGGVLGRAIMPVIHNALKGNAGPNANLGQITRKGYILPTRAPLIANKARGTMSSANRAAMGGMY